MLSQRLAVVAREHDEGAFVEVQLAQAEKEPAKLRVVESDFTIVEVAGVARELRLRGAIRAVRIVQMHPQEERLAKMGIQPRQGAVHGPVATTLEQ